MGSGDVRVHVGLGQHDHIDTLQLRWPTGRLQTLLNVPAGGTLIIEESPD